jgi:hypothetical protein
MTLQIPLDRDSTALIGDKDDVLVWPDGTWCYYFERAEYSHMSDDYRVIPYLNAEWFAVTNQMPF